MAGPSTVPRVAHHCRHLAIALRRHARRPVVGARQLASQPMGPVQDLDAVQAEESVPSLLLGGNLWAHAMSENSWHETYVKLA